MTSTKCWHCHKLAQMVDPINQFNWTMTFPGGEHPITFPDSRFGKRDETNSSNRLRIYSCVNCGYPNIAETRTVFINDEQEYSHENDLQDITEDFIVRWLPVEPVGKDYPDVPESVASIADEAHKCREIGANRAAITMARSALEGIVSDQEEAPSKKKLFERIEDLKKAGKITSRTADAASAIRLCGNNSVHNINNPVDEELVDIVIKILDSTIEDLYAHPRLVQQAKDYRAKSACLGEN